MAVIDHKNNWGMGGGGGGVGLKIFMKVILSSHLWYCYLFFWGGGLGPYVN